jgi:(p)ppGpp synthase/HD superfamily hydrolase
MDYSSEGKELETPNDGGLWQRAISFAAQQHNGQYRKDGKTPYIAHPM